MQKLCFTLLLSLILCTGLVGQNLTHGPVVGGVTESSAVFVLRTDTAAVVQVAVSTTTDFSDPVYSTSFNTADDSAYFGKVFVSELQSNTKYYYRAEINEGAVVEDSYPYFSTFQQPGTASTFMFHTGSCQQDGPDPQSGIGNIFPIMALEEPAFFVHQGDWGYPDTTDVEQGTPENFFSLDYSRVIDTYFARYDPNFPMIDLLRVTPVAYTYDDHDMIDNNSDGYLFPRAGIRNSIIGYESMFPGYPLPDTSKGIYHKFSYGNCDIFMLDNRSQRTPNLGAFDIYAADSVVFNPGFGHTILGADQMAWFLQELSNSTARWKFISTGTPFNPAWRAAIELAVLSQGVIDSVGVPGEGYITPTEIAVELSDKWGGFPGDIYQVINHIYTNNIENVIFLSGDTHTSGLDDGQNSIFPEMMAGPVDRTNGQLLRLFAAFAISIWNSGGHTPFLAQEEYGNAYGRVTVFGDDSVALEAVAENGNLLGRHVVENGFLPRTVGAAVAPLGLDFGEVEVGNLGIQAFIVVSTSVDTLVVNDIGIGGSYQIFVDPATGNTPFSVAPGEKHVVGVAFLPAVIGDTSQALIQVVTNDPENPAFLIPAQGIAKAPDAIATAEDVPLEFKLYQNYPNPFNPATRIKFALPQPGAVRIELFNLLGQKVDVLLDKDMATGFHEIEYVADKLPSGIYFYRIEAGTFRQVKKMMLIK